MKAAELKFSKNSRLGSEMEEFSEQLENLGCKRMPL